MAKAGGPGYKVLRDAVDSIRADRATLATLFDAALALRKAAGTPDLPASFMQSILLGEAAAAQEPVEFDRTLALDAFALALRGTGNARFAHELLVELIQHGLADQPDSTPEAINQARNALLDRLPVLLFTPPERTAELESKTHSDAAFASPEAVLACLAKAQARLCRVTAQPITGEAKVGTGFLIGPSCVLTNWHVVDRLSRPKLADSEKLLVEFDFSQAKTGQPRIENQYVAAPEWLVAHSEVGKLVPADASSHRQLDAAGVVSADWWMDDGCRQAWCDSLGSSLDYAVIRLQGSPGARRAYFDLWAPSPAATAGAAMTSDCLVVHHPLGIGQAVNPGVIHTELNHGSRLFHTASTERGSSGAMLFELRTGQPVGLHHLGLGPAAVPPAPAPSAPQQVVNVAVSLEAIAADIAGKAGARQAIAQASELMLNKGCLVTGEPVFARKRLLTALSDMRSGTSRILWIEVPRDPNGNAQVNYGRSYSARIIETLFPEPANLHIRLEAANIPADAAALVRLLAERIVLDPGAAATLAIPDKETSAEAYDKVLFDYFADLVLRHRKSALVWLVVDDLDVHDLPDTDSRRFLDRLYAQVHLIPQMRIVLIGLRIQIQSLPETLLARNTIDVLNVATLEFPLRDWLDEHSAGAGPLGAKARDLVAALALSGITDGNALRELHAFTRDRIEPVLSRHLGAAT